MSSAHVARIGRRLCDDRGVAFYPQLILAVLILMVTSAALVRNIYQAHDTSLQEFRRIRVMEELQAELEYWKANVYLYGPSHPRPSARRTIPIETGKRRSNEYIMGEFDPAPQITQIRLNGANAYQIQVTLRWPEGGEMRQESLLTAVNQLR